ncbi:hypothetical protein P67b_00080 [Ruegeria phage Tedan]|nr:hypothetical protein P67b_00080 [Ruegeria phage Tedan]
MTNILFGLNIAQIVDESIQAAGGVLTGQLIKPTSGTRTPGNLTGGTNPTDTTYSFRGFTDNQTSGRQNGSLVRVSGETVSILGNSLPAGIEPEAGDEIVIEGRRYEALEVVERDPAAALYVVAVSR